MIGRRQYRDEDIDEADYFEDVEKISHIEGNEFLHHSLSQLFMSFLI